MLDSLASLVKNKSIRPVRVEYGHENLEQCLESVTGELEKSHRAAKRILISESDLL